MANIELLIKCSPLKCKKKHSKIFRSIFIVYKYCKKSLSSLRCFSLVEKFPFGYGPLAIRRVQQADFCLRFIGCNLVRIHFLLLKAMLPERRKYFVSISGRCVSEQKWIHCGIKWQHEDNEP